MPSLPANRWSRAGVLLILVCWSPLLLVWLLSLIGLWPDPHPNPVGPGLLFGLSVWPAVICLGIGAWQTRRR